VAYENACATFVLAFMCITLEVVSTMVLITLTERAQASAVCAIVLGTSRISTPVVSLGSYLDVQSLSAKIEQIYGLLVTLLWLSSLSRRGVQANCSVCEIVQRYPTDINTGCVAGVVS
jgi:hypothetical protein